MASQRISVTISPTASSARKADKSCNLEQLRAKNALAVRKEIGKTKGGGKSRAVAKKVPTMIINNGFLGAMAFAIESIADGYKKENSGYADVFVAILKHLDGVRGLPRFDIPGLAEFFTDFYSPGSNRSKTKVILEDVLEKKLVELKPGELRALTDEALMFLNYLRRFAEDKEDKPSKTTGGENA